MSTSRPYSPGLRECQEFYDERWQKQAYIGAYKRQRLAAILQELSRLEGSPLRILDAGCGSGWLTAVLSHLGPCVGVDITPRTLGRAKREVPRAAFVAADGCAMPFRAGVFDVVVSQEVLEHIMDKSRYIDSIAQCLRTGGHLLLTTPNGDLAEGMVVKDQPIEEYVTRKDLLLLLNRHFEIEHLTTIIPAYAGHLKTHPVNWGLLKSFAARMRAVKWLDTLQGILLRAGHFLVVAEKR